jgi:hypothetical protein
MLSRLGKVLNFGFALIAVLFIAAAALFASNNPHEPATAVFLGGVGAIVFLVGLASRFVLAGD